MRIFITGGAGFLGRAIMARPALFSPDPVDFTVYSRDEFKQAHARALFPNVHYILGDVRDRDRLELAMRGHDVVIHAAAMKYVLRGETDVWEAIDINVDGSRNVAQAAARTGVRHLIGLSTDKACRPVNVYGMSKLLMERLFQEADSWSSTQINLVRYGNVVSSTGSAVPLFRQQAREGRITLTDPNMTRFWLTVERAIGLIAAALTEPRGGTILIPRLPSATIQVVADAAVKVELARNPDLREVEYEVIGQRFGEKVHENLLGPEETPYTAPGQVMHMFPVTEGRRLNHQQDMYTSNTPDHIIDVDEMVKLIKEGDEC